MWLMFPQTSGESSSRFGRRIASSRGNCWKFTCRNWENHRGEGPREGNGKREDDSSLSSSTTMFSCFSTVSIDFFSFLKIIISPHRITRSLWIFSTRSWSRREREMSWESRNWKKQYQTWRWTRGSKVVFILIDRVSLLLYLIFCLFRFYWVIIENKSS